MAEKTYVVKAKKGSEEFVTVTARNHNIIIDEPVEQGGTDTGMNPVEMLLGSISACLTLTINIYAEAMGVKVKNTEVTVEGDIDSAGMKGSARVRPGYRKIRVTVEAETVVAPEMFQQVVDLAMIRCPVEDSVKNAVEFEEPKLIVHQVKE